MPRPARVTPITPEQIEAVNASPFTALGLSQTIVRAVLDEEYTTPTPVQAAVIPDAASGRDVLALAQTGTGKTAAFVLPILEMLSRATSIPDGIRVLVLTPTRELAAQIGESVAAYGRYLRLEHAVVYGGVSQHRQEIALQRKPSILIATPGRLLDLMNQRLVKLDAVKHFVLDEADRMLDMGFVHDVRRVAAVVPKERQTMLFSATMPSSVESLAEGLMKDPVRVAVTPKVTSAETVEQSVVFVQKDKKGALLERVLQGGDVGRAIVFTRTKHGANRVSKRLEQAGIGAPAIHGNKSQNARERALGEFRSGKTRVLIATDIAARGIDVTDITHVINFDLPDVPESYVHRVGRTGRAGASGRAISFCDHEERALLRDIERLLRKPLPVLEGASFGVDLGSDERRAPAQNQPDQRDRQERRSDSNDRGGQSRPQQPRHHGQRPQQQARPQHSGGGRPQHPGAGRPQQSGGGRPQHGAPQGDRRERGFRPHGAR